VSKVNPGDIEVVGCGEVVAETLCKVLPSGLHDVLLDDPSDRANTILINIELDGGIELANDLLGEWMVESHQWEEPQLVTNFLGLSKVLGLEIQLL
jgi:hypothetical protein